MNRLVAENIGLAFLIAAGIFAAASILADRVCRAVAPWEPMIVDRGEIVEVRR